MVQAQEPHSRSRPCTGGNSEAINLRQWERIRSLFTGDARFEDFAFAADGGPAEFLATVSAFLTGVRNTHQGFMPILVDHGPGKISGPVEHAQRGAGQQDVPSEIPVSAGIHDYVYNVEEPAHRRPPAHRLLAPVADPDRSVLVQASDPGYDVIGPSPDWDRR